MLLQIITKLLYHSIVLLMMLINPLFRITRYSDAYDLCASVLVYVLLIQELCLHITHKQILHVFMVLCLVILSKQATKYSWQTRMIRYLLQIFLKYSCLRNHFLTKIEILFRLLRRYAQLHIFENQGYDILSKHVRDVNA